MKPFPVYLDELLADPLGNARAAANRIVGYVNTVPVELILAAGALPLRLPANLSALTPQADVFLERSFSPESRAVAELYLRGELADIETVILPRNDDSAQRLYYYLRELQRRGRAARPRPLLYDVASLARPSSFEYTLESTRLLAQELAADESRIAQARARVRERAALLAEVRARSDLPGSIRYRIEMAAEFDWRSTFDAVLSNWLPMAPRVAGKRLLLVGNAPPDERLHRAVEQVQGNVVYELVRTQIAAPAAGTTDPWIDIARRHHEATTVAQTLAAAPQQLIERAKALDAQGVIFWLITEDEALPWEIVNQRSLLHAARLPVLTLTCQCWHATEETLDAIRDFVTHLEDRQ